MREVFVFGCVVTVTVALSAFILFQSKKHDKKHDACSNNDNNNANKVNPVPVSASAASSALRHQIFAFNDNDNSSHLVLLRTCAYKTMKEYVKRGYARIIGYNDDGSCRLQLTKATNASISPSIHNRGCYLCGATAGVTRVSLIPPSYLPALDASSKQEMWRYTQLACDITITINKNNNSTNNNNNNNNNNNYNNNNNNNNNNNSLSVRDDGRCQATAKLDRARKQVYARLAQEVNVPIDLDREIQSVLSSARILLRLISPLLDSLSFPPSSSSSPSPSTSSSCSSFPSPPPSPSASSSTCSSSSSSSSLSSSSSFPSSVCSFSSSSSSLSSLCVSVNSLFSHLPPPLPLPLTRFRSLVRRVHSFIEKGRTHTRSRARAPTRTYTVTQKTGRTSDSEVEEEGEPEQQEKEIDVSVHQLIHIVNNFCCRGESFVSFLVVHFCVFSCSGDVYSHLMKSVRPLEFDCDCDCELSARVIRSKEFLQRVSDMVKKEANF